MESRIAVEVILEDARGSLWLGGPDGLVRFTVDRQAGQLRGTETRVESPPVRGLCMPSDTECWAIVEEFVPLPRGPLPHCWLAVVDAPAGPNPRLTKREDLPPSVREAYQRLTSKQAQGRHGTGMGLYISRQLARRMGGDIQAQSEGPGRGARFVVTLRRA